VREAAVVPLPRWLAQTNRRYTNRLMRHLASWAPGFAIVHHVGRRSGRSYETPVNVFRRPGGFLFALTYGETDWVRNVLAAGRCEIRTRRRTVALGSPRTFRDERLPGIPVPARWILSRLRVDQLVEMTAVDDSP
jgi:deazaflavin-dependent oxidoreductase (nitroreductase family)